MRRLRHSLEHYQMLRAGDRAGVAVSGGADSVALLLLLVGLEEELGVVLSVAHFNHQLRGKSSEADQKFVERLAAKYGLPFHVESADVAAKAKRDKTNLEDTARRARYGFFRKLVDNRTVTRVAVAHTADDQAETVLAHILRGTGLAGLGGIHPVAEHIVRPLIEVRRAELRTYLRMKNQSWREDTTNRDTTKLRARIRRKLIPLLEKHFQSVAVEHLTTLAELAREDEAFLEALVAERTETLVEKQADSARIRIEDLLHPLKTREFGAEARESTDKEEKSTALSKRIVRHIVEGVKLRAGQLGAKHVGIVLDLARHGESGSALPLPGGAEVRKERDRLIFQAHRNAETHITESTAREYEYNIDLVDGSAAISVPGLGCVFRLRVIDWPAKRGETNKLGAVLDRDRLRFPLVLRNWHPGDRLRPLGYRNTHKLKRLLNEKRISRWERDGWPVLTSGGVLAWARGFSVAAEFAADERTRAGIVIAEETFS
jgi:tRNA(Ile)-lysidine synthase